MNCARLECTAKATHTPKICVPGFSYPLKGHQPYQALLGLTLCMTHCKEIDVQQFLKDERLKDAIRVSARGGAPPDFTRAFLTIIALNSPEWREFQKAINNRKPEPVEVKDG